MEFLFTQRPLKLSFTLITGNTNHPVTTCHYLLVLAPLLSQEMLVYPPLIWTAIDAYFSLICSYQIDGQVKSGSGVDQVYFRVANNAFIDGQSKKVTITHSPSDLSGLRMPFLHFILLSIWTLSPITIIHAMLIFNLIHSFFFKLDD